MLTEDATSEELLGFAESLSRTACTGGGPKALGALLAAALDAAVLIEDAEWRHVALVGAGARSVPGSARDVVPASARGGDAPITISAPGAGPGALAVRIRSGDAYVGWLSIFPNARSPERRLGLVRLATAAIAVEMSREIGGGKNRRKSFWDRLLARAYDDPIEAKDDATSRGISLAPAYVAVAVEAEGLDEASAATKNGELRRICLETLRSGGSGEIVVLERGGGFVLLCPAPLEVDAANVRTAAGFIGKAAVKAQFGAKIVGGVGRATDAIAAARTVEEAREAMFISRRIFGGSRVLAYEDLGVYPLLLRGGTSAEEWREFGARILAPLRAYDEKHQTELIRTLRLYFGVGQNVKTAAAELSVHRHTVFYRLRQIGEISGNDLDSPHDQLTLRAAMAIDALVAR